MATNDSIDTVTQAEPIGGQQDDIMTVRDLVVSYETGEGKANVVNGVDVDIHRGEILGIVGESGSGKSMFASALLDAVEKPGKVSGDITYQPAEGEAIDVLDIPTAQLKSLRWEEISMVFQGALSSFNPTMTIKGHFEETLRAHDVGQNEGIERARELLSDLYLDPDRVLDSYPHELSGGMSQRALIALSIVLEPSVLVMDEPTGALDLLMQRSILSLIDDVQEKYNLSIVFITHDLPLVAGLADRLGVLYAFEIVELGPSDEIITEPGHPYTRSLLKAVPNLDAPLDTMQPIDGSAPHPSNIPAGCTYADRCSLATEECLEEHPPFHDIGTDNGGAASTDEDHFAACYHWERARAEMPLEIDADAYEGTVDRERRPTADDETVVTLDDVEVHFEKDQNILDLFEEPDIVRAVDGVSLEIPENDVVALVGESGCGKTTLGKTGIAAQRPTGGTVSYRGQDIWATKDDGIGEIDYKEIRKSLQIIHQDPGGALNPNRTVMASLAAPLKRWQPDLESEDRQARVLGMLERCGLEPAADYANRYPHQLSGGEQQRVALIRALLMNPDMILADEAVSALDVSLRVEMMNLMLELQEQFNTSYLFISHNLSNARYLAEKSDGRLGIMYLGEIVEIGPAGEVLTDPKHPYTKVLKWATASVEPDQEVSEPPIRSIDIPDPVNPPSGCRFHTRCPEAREVCKHESPALGGDIEGGRTHSASCFRDDEDHEYWDSEPLTDEDTMASIDETV
ncbi:ABC transporter ATP-binding protein [Halorhabdus sp. CUG00001]|uniref:ABC transporter ATP-binding protein n=1 Tax=Halorhabdus sp. CUG00001 TaxID=2600297 RepID=UPI00131C20E4|nr:ABC transporter ATP-binding protein [Halorhabdus sp. CUG00001]